MRFGYGYFPMCLGKVAKAGSEGTYSFYFIFWLAGCGSEVS